MIEIRLALRILCVVGYFNAIFDDCIFLLFFPQVAIIRSLITPMHDEVSKYLSTED